MSTLFPASVIGSMPRSEFVKDLIMGDTEVSPAEYEKRMDAAVRYIVAVQEQAGVDVVTDGEWRRKSYIGVVAELAHGFELSRAEDGRPMTIVTDKLSPKTPGFISKEVTFVQNITSKKIKATLTYPMSTGRNFAEILRLLDSCQLTANEQVATPANWEHGEDVIIVPAVSNEAAAEKYPDGWDARLPYLRYVKDPSA